MALAGLRCNRSGGPEWLKILSDAIRDDMQGVFVRENGEWKGREAVEKCIRDQVEPEPFSGVVRISEGGRVLFENAYGLAIRPEAIPNRAETRFQTASGCKVFTAAAVLQLIDRGELHLGTPLAACVNAEFPDYDPGITIEHLLTHTSGITSYFEEDLNPDYELLWRKTPMYGIRRPADFLPLFQNKPMKFKPGERFDYNDGGYILLGLVIEAVSGKSFAGYVEEQVFAPAGMIDSGYFPTDRLPARTAYAYIKNEDGSWRTNFFAVPIVGAPDGGAYTTAADLAKFWETLRSGKLLSAPVLNTMLQPRVATGDDAPYSHYGCGVWIDRPGSPGGTDTATTESIRKIFVEGSDPGVALRSAVYPDKDLTLTLIGNTGSALWPLYRSIERTLEI
jgi:CubicO group peptidase (beta-lactamase class C family)